MKPRKQPMQRTELRRVTPLKRTTTPRTSGPVKPRMVALLKRHPGRQSPEEKAGRVLLKKRSGGRCEVAVPGVCIGIGVVWSHRKRRSQSSKAEKWSITNGLHGCGPCELYLTDHGSDPHVRAHGWTVHPSDDPALIAVTKCIGADCDLRTSEAVA